MGSHFAQNTTPNPCSLLIRHTPFSFGDMYLHKTPPTSPHLTPFPGLNMIVGKVSYRLGNLDPNWAKCLKSGQFFSRSGQKNIIHSSTAAGRCLDWRVTGSPAVSTHGHFLFFSFSFCSWLSWGPDHGWALTRTVRLKVELPSRHDRALTQEILHLVPCLAKVTVLIAVGSLRALWYKAKP